MILNYLTAFSIGVLTGIIGNYFYARLAVFFREKTEDSLIGALNDKENWNREDNEKGERYFYTGDPDFTIDISEGKNLLAERFKKFPDREHNYIHNVIAKYKGAPLFNWNFMSLDGFRAFIPIPRGEFETMQADEDAYYDFYDLNSLEIKIFEVIGTANLMGEKSKVEGLRTIAGILNVLISQR